MNIKSRKCEVSLCLGGFNPEYALENLFRAVISSKPDRHLGRYSASLLLESSALQCYVLFSKSYILSYYNPHYDILTHNPV